VPRNGGRGRESVRGARHIDSSTGKRPQANRVAELCPLSRLTPYKNNARTHSKKQIRQIANSIKRFGFTNPVLVDDAGHIIAGHGRVGAADPARAQRAPMIRVSHLSETEKTSRTTGWRRRPAGIRKSSPLSCRVWSPSTSMSRSPASRRPTSISRSTMPPRQRANRPAPKMTSPTCRPRRCPRNSDRRDGDENLPKFQ
jgi:hypothetical protein